MKIGPISIFKDDEVDFFFEIYHQSSKSYLYLKIGQIFIIFKIFNTKLSF